MFDFSKAVEAAGVYRAAREELGVMVKNIMIDENKVWIDDAMIGLRGKSYLVRDGNIHRVYMTYDWDIEPGYVNMVMFDGNKFLAKDYQFRVKVDSMDGKLVTDVRAAHKAWKESMIDTDQTV